MAYARRKTKKEMFVLPNSEREGIAIAEKQIDFRFSTDLHVL